MNYDSHPEMVFYRSTFMYSVLLKTYISVSETDKRNDLWGCKIFITADYLFRVTFSSSGIESSDRSITYRKSNSDIWINERLEAFLGIFSAYKMLLDRSFYHKMVQSP